MSRARPAASGRTIHGQQRKGFRIVRAGLPSHIETFVRFVEGSTATFRQPIHNIKRPSRIQAYLLQKCGRC